MSSTAEAPETESPFQPPPPIGPDEVAPDEDEQPQPEPEPDEQPQPDTAPPSDAEMEARIKKAERATARYVGQISAALEDEAVHLIECPLCLPFARGFVHVQDAGRVPEDVRSAVEYFLTGVQQVEYKPSPHYATCSVCAGEGKVLSGSKVPQFQTVICNRCNGQGYVSPLEQQTNGSAPEQAPQLAAVPAPTDIDTGDHDPTGEPRKLPDGRDNPNYGKWPQYKQLIDPWGITAGLVGPKA